jgi:hypothetical protein
MIERVIFLQGDNALEGLNIYNNEGVKGLFNYLVQWHYEGEHETADQLSAGSSDRTYKIDDYVLTVNTMIGYIGLEFLLK